MSIFSQYFQQQDWKSSVFFKNSQPKYVMSVYKCIYMIYSQKAIYIEYVHVYVYEKFVKKQSLNLQME